MGLTVVLLPADGDAVETPRQYRRAERSLVKCQRRVAKRVKGSQRRRKVIAVLARAHQQVRRQRADCQHQTALALVRQDATLSVAAMHPANLRRRPEPQLEGNGGYLKNGASRKAGLNQSIQDAGWSQLLSHLAFKAAGAGKRVEAVSPAYTPQECSGCGERIYKRLSVRTHGCPTCGLILDREEHAAKTIVWRGQRLRGLVA